jgi:hypothetical protein
MAATVAHAQQAKLERKTTAAILDMEANGVSDVEVSALSERMRFEMFHTGVFNVMERGKMQEILKEQGFQQTGACNTNACAVEVGQLIGVEKMVAGSLGKVGSTYTVILRLIDVRTGQVEQSVAQDFTGEIDRLLTSVLKSVAGSMAAAVKSSQTMAEGALPGPISRPVYKKWWFWGGIGGATVGGILAALLGGKGGTPSAETPPPTETPQPIDNPPAH